MAMQYQFQRRNMSCCRCLCLLGWVSASWRMNLYNAVEECCVSEWKFELGLVFFYRWT
jgi:hypothetical protein